MCQATTTPATKIHQFTQAGLGQAPFHVVGFQSTEDRVGLNRYAEARGMVYTTNPCGGTCDYCGTAIFNVFQVESADGNRFKVGCECVLKAGDAGLRRVVNQVTALAAKAVRQAREAVKVASAEHLIKFNQAALRSLPHPHAYRASLGETFADYVDFCWKQSGTAGKIRLRATVLKALGATG